MPARKTKKKTSKASGVERIPKDVLSVKMGTDDKTVRFKLFANPSGDGVDLRAVNRFGEPREKSLLLTIHKTGLMERHANVSDKLHLKKNRYGQLLQKKFRA